LSSNVWAAYPGCDGFYPPVSFWLIQSLETSALHISFIVSQGTPCDLVTGEERRCVSADGEPSAHVACTVEMTSVNMPCELSYILFVVQFITLT